MSGFIDPTAIIGHPPEHFAKPYEQELYFAPEIDPSARIFKLVTVDAGTLAPTLVGARTQMFAHSHAGHDVKIGDDCQIATGAVIGGHATIHNRVRVGLNATVLPYKTVGVGARVGGGAVVTKDVPAHSCVMGNPARVAYWFCEHCGDKIPHGGLCSVCALDLAVP